ncbi:class II lanthipeptide, LchA2/BrtA2 family [Corynebacterium phocae]|uniref:class II lanthipeptide, LchA2/BrtA2 family n=1 Tax=Corynebacterium phocae TaxID=161895 RepID=UPI001470B4D3|nr:class II lanthipeptide, LchA2/BrtA2 family [Corynebacterium phocae]
MSNYTDIVDNYREDELRVMIDAEEGVNGATHPLVATAVCVMSLMFCPTTNCTDRC